MSEDRRATKSEAIREQVLVEALEELVSAVKDGWRRANAGNPLAIKSNAISATMHQAEVALASLRVTHQDGKLGL